MALDTDRLDVITFDSFGTLVDVDSTARVLPDAVENPVALAREWHERAAQYGMVGNFIDAYETYYDLHRAALSYLFEREGIEADEDAVAEMTAVYHEMDPFEDVREGMARLREDGYRLGIITNGDPAMVDSLLATTGVGDLLDAAVSADAVETHKPARELYAHAADRLDADPGRVAHASYSQVDVQGAMHAGMGGIWLNRQGGPLDPFGPDPDLTVETIDDIADR